MAVTRSQGAASKKPTKETKKGSATKKPSSCGCSLYRSAAAPPPSRMKQAMSDTWETMSKYTVDACKKEASMVFSKEIDNDLSFCDYDGYYFFGTAISYGIYFALLQSLIVPYKVAKYVYERPGVSKVVFVVVETLKMCKSAAEASSSAARDRRVQSTAVATGYSAACIAMGTPIVKLLDSVVGDILKFVLKTSSSASGMTIKAAASFLKEHWHHIRPVYLAHRLRTASLSKTVQYAIDKVGMVGPTIFSSIAASLLEYAKRAPLLLLTHTKKPSSTEGAPPLLLTYQPPPTDEKRTTRSSTPHSTHQGPLIK
jgi:hypothetical protein